MTLVPDVQPDWRPTFSGGIGKKKPASRRRAGAARWAEIREHKLGPCRVCGGTVGIQMHHLVPRSQGGSDTEANITPLCRPDHDAVTRGDRHACATLRASLTDAEYAYAVDMLGEARFEARYPVEYRVA